MKPSGRSPFSDSYGPISDSYGPFSDSYGSLAWQTDVAVWELVGGGSQLEYLSLAAHGDTDVTDDALLAIGAGDVILKSCVINSCHPVTM